MPHFAEIFHIGKIRPQAVVTLYMRNNNGISAHLKLSHSIQDILEIISRENSTRMYLDFLMLTAFPVFNSSGTSSP